MDFQALYLTKGWFWGLDKPCNIFLELTLKFSALILEVLKVTKFSENGFCRIFLTNSKSFFVTFQILTWLEKVFFTFVPKYGQLLVNLFG